MYRVENDNIIIELKQSGAELTRIFSKKYNKEILWNGDSKYWGRHSPVLFPIVGRLKDNETIIDGNSYNMSQHGFARDMEFEVYDTTDNTTTYKLTSNEESKKLYPFDFELFIKYTLGDSSVNIEWTVKNTDNKDIHFSIGAHPAFNISSSDDISNYYLEFKGRDNIEVISLEGPYHNEFRSIDNISRLNLETKTFENDAIIYTNIDEVAFKSTKEDFYINVDLKDFPLVGIWTPYYQDSNSTAPFICIEPWYGLADSIDTDKVYENKKFINKLGINEVFSANYTIEIV